MYLLHMHMHANLPVIHSRQKIRASFQCNGSCKRRTYMYDKVSYATTVLVVGQSRLCIGSAHPKYSVGLFQPYCTVMHAIHVAATHSTQV